jgi:hypothetical protein
MQHTKIIIKKLSASLFGKEQGEGSSLNANSSRACSDDSGGSSHGYQVRRRSQCAPRVVQAAAARHVAHHLQDLLNVCLQDNQQPACPIYHHDVGQPTPDNNTQFSNQSQVRKFYIVCLACFRVDAAPAG